jgi:hypothetical protein
MFHVYDVPAIIIIIKVLNNDVIKSTKSHDSNTAEIKISIATI